jgi:hypothetical protein
MPKRAVKLEHTLMRAMIQQLTLLVMHTSLAGRDNQSDWYGEDQRVVVRIKITIMLLWSRTTRFMSKPAKR